MSRTAGRTSPRIAAPRTTLRTAGLLLAGALVLTTAAVARADDAEALARDAVASLAQAEKELPAGKLTVSVQERRGAYKDGETEDDIATRLKSERPLLAEGSLTYGAEGWRKDLLFPPSEPGRPVTRTTTSETGGVLRLLVEVSRDGSEQRRAQVTRVPITAPGDAVFSRRVTVALAGVHWETGVAVGPLVTLRGTRDGERHTLILTRSETMPPVFRIKHWDLSRATNTAAGDRREQTYAVEITPGEGSLFRLEEWVVNPPPTSSVAYRVTDVKKVEPVSALKPGELDVRFPRGTVVTDSRGEVPVEYEQTEVGVSDAEVARTAADLARERVAAGHPAPALDLIDLKGKPIRLADFANKTLVIYWFNTQAPNAEAAATFIRELSDAYRRRGVKFLALNVAEEGDASAKAEEFGKKSRWEFPVAVDLGTVAMRHYGLEAGVPKLAIVDRKGTLTYVRPGLDADAISAELDRLVKDSGKK